MTMHGDSWGHTNVNKHACITLSLLAAALFLKCVILRRCTGADDILDAGQLCSAYLSIGAAALGAGMIAWLPKRLYAILFLILTDLWFIALIWYHAANNAWLNAQAVFSISELRGFESSILAYLAWPQLLLPLTTFLAAYLLVVIPARKPATSLRVLAANVGAIIILCLFATIGRAYFPQSEEDKMQSFHAERNFYIAIHSPLAHLAMIGKEIAQDSFFRWNALRPFSEREKTILADIHRQEQSPNEPQGHLVYILVESLENWPLETYDDYGRDICPCINAYIHSRPRLYVKEIETQQVYGRSGDGQLITQTGLLPLSSGIACRQFGGNTYPNLAHFYANSAVLNPYFIPVWNQEVVTHSYGFQRLISPRRFLNENDSILLSRTQHFLSQAKAPAMALVLTIDTHTPFRTRQDTATLDDHYTETEKAYLRSVRYTDRQIGAFLQWADTAAVMQNATVVITADHNHFERRDGKGLCPFILVSPCITQSVSYLNALQMDIFPTVLHAIGQSNYTWRGLGVDLLDADAPAMLRHRPVSAREAYALSDKLIRMNYFANPCSKR